MVGFILRRIAVSILVLLAASFIMYVLAANSGDPLQDLRDSSAANRDQLIAARVAALDLNVPVPLRYFLWLGGAAGCLIPFAGTCNLGLTISNAAVLDILPTAIGSTLQLVTASFVLAIVLGIVVGVVSALRQYSGFDFGITLLSFFLFSLPSFLVAVLLKEFMALGFNNFLESATAIPIWLIVLLGVIAAVVWQAMIGGDTRRRLIVAGSAGLATVALLVYFNLTDWFRNPGLGPVGLLLLIAGIVVITTALIAGLRNRRALLVAALNGAIAYICYFALQGLFDISTFATIIILGVVAVAVGLVSGYVLGAPDRGMVARIGGMVAFLSGALVVLDRYMQSWPQYVSNPRINGRPIATVGAGTPGFTGDMWITGIDTFTPLLLPTISLLLISFAGYTRYARAGMLEVMNQDYIRTARAKGLRPHVVILKHALRNAIIPVVALAAVQFGFMLGGSIVIEAVFNMQGLGYLAWEAIARNDFPVVQAVVLILAVIYVALTFLADVGNAFLDPRIRLA